jgi:Uma2 family endonuclease
MHTIDDYPMDDGNRYELIDGTVYKSSTPHLLHQRIVCKLSAALASWDMQESKGEVFPVPGVLFSDRDVVAPDIVWTSRERWPALIDTNDERGWIIGAPDLVIEVLSAGPDNEHYDRVIKLDLYDRFGVQEYWIVDRFARLVDVYRREAGQLVLAAQLGASDELTSPLLSGFVCLGAAVFAVFFADL